MRRERWRVGRWGRRVRTEGGARLGIGERAVMVGAMDVDVADSEAEVLGLVLGLPLALDLAGLLVDGGVVDAVFDDVDNGMERVATGMYSAARRSGSDFVV